MQDDNKITEDMVRQALGSEAEGKEIVFVTQEKVSLYCDEIDLVLEAIGIEEAWISDWSHLSDFSGCAEDADENEIPYEEWVGIIGNKLGIELAKDGNYLWEMAEKIHQKVS